MNKPTLHFSIVLFLGLLFSCNPKVSRKELKEAERLMLSHPDSALHMLESIPSPEKMSRADYAAYCLLLTEAQDKSYYTFTSDSVIQVPAEYYEAKNDKRKLPKVYYYLGRVHQEMQAIPYALEYYLKAENSVGDDFHDRRLLSRIYNSIGSIYTQLHIYDNALEAYKQAEHYLYACEDSVGLPFVLRNMARIYHATEKLDSAVWYYEQAIQRSREVKNKYALVSSLLEITGLYLDQKEMSKAQACLSDYSGLVPEQSAPDQAILIFAQFYQGIGKLDSASLYYRKSLNSPNVYTKAASYYRLSHMAKEQGDYRKAFDYADLYNSYRDIIQQNTDREETLRAENLYNYQKIINEKEKMEQEHRRRQYIITSLSFLSVFGFLFTVVLFLYQRKRKAVAVLAKEKQLRIQSALYQKSMERIKDNEEQLIFLRSKLDALDQTEKDSIKTRIDILEHENKSLELRQGNKRLQYKKLASSPVYIRLKEGESGILRKKEIWIELKQVVDEIDGCLETKLRGYYLGISQREIEVCYLLKANFSISEIANLMGSVASSVSKCRKRLYEKIHGSAGSGKDLDQFIDSL